jgi:hypothetical protein
MPITLTIKQVPDVLAAALRRRAEGNRRSQQRELLLILERALGESPDAGLPGIREPVAGYATGKKRAARAATVKRPQSSGRLSLKELWQRARTIGAPMPGESTDIIRRDRDARHGR